MTRLPPVARDDWPPEMADALAAMTPSVQRHPKPPLEDRPRAMGVLGTLAHHPELAKALFTFNGHLLWATSITPRQREMIVLRVAARRRAAFLWGMHVFEARDAGLTEEEIGRVAFGPDAPYWDPLDAAILRGVDELIDDGEVTEPTWQVLDADLEPQQLLDLLFTAGCYLTLSWLYRTVDLEPDPDVPGMYERYQPPSDEER